MHPFEIVLSIPTEDIEFEFRGHAALPWGDYLLNPRRLRGSDFLMRWSQGAWSEERDELISRGLIEPTIQTFQAPAGATAKKIIYKFYYHYAYPLGQSTEEPNLVPAHIEDKNGHILPFVKFEGGSLELSQEALAVLEAAGRK